MPNGSGDHSGPAPRPIELPRVADLTDPGTLADLLGAPVTTVKRSTLAGIGYGGSVHELLQVQLAGTERRLHLKRTALAEVWPVYRSGDRIGREAALLGERALDGAWEAFACPYLAYAAEAGEIGLLMDDLTDALLPDVDEPITEVQEDALLVALARLHARYWGAPELRLPWLTSPEARFAIIGPRAADEEASRPASARFAPFFEMMRTGWEAALRRLRPEAAELVSLPPERLAARCADLPWTLLHGDTKVGNLAWCSDGRVAAFDWEIVGVGPPTLDLGYHLAVNSSRLARPKDAVIARYRELLEAELVTRIDDRQWRRLVDVGILCGAVMLLWPKALGLESGDPRAAPEWDWWADRLRTIAAAG